MRIQAEGVFAGAVTSAEWEDGRLATSNQALAELLNDMDACPTGSIEGIPVRQSWRVQPKLSDAHSVYWALMALLGTEPKVTGGTAPASPPVDLDL